MTIDILYQDNHLVVVNKPAGLLTQPSGTDQDSIEKRAKEWIKAAYNKPGAVFLEAVHRIDKPVSGIVVFARTSKALSRLNASMREKATKKTYIALVEGVVQPTHAVLEHYLVHDDFQAQSVHKDHPEGKLARLSYKVLDEKEGQSLLEIELETGRYHQIRCQLAAIGFPIVGDHKYGSHIPLPHGVIALHHWRLMLPHPISQELLTFKAPLPPLLVL